MGRSWRHGCYSLVLLCMQGSAMAQSTIRIKGMVKDNACEVAVGSREFTVDLMNSAVKQFARVGDATPRVPFVIQLSRCGGSARAVRVGFSGAQDRDNTALLKLEDGVGSATGVAIQIMDGDRVQIPVAATQDQLKWTPLLAGQSNTLQFFARIMSSRAEVVGGSVRATGEFTLEFL